MSKSTISEVAGRASFPQMEDKIIEFWKENKIFEKSVEQRPEDNKYSFVDGPPFVSGMPHPAHLFVSIAKDLIPRYWTMRGKRVRRVFGWDCHGLPIEAKVNKKFGLKDRVQIEQEFGVDRYVEECRKYVEEHITNWRWYIDKIGRWADMDNAYHTMYPEFNESVIWAFKQAWDKGLVYKGKRVSLYSTDTQTPVSNFEVAMDADNYVDTEDLAVFVKFQLKDHPWSEQTGGADLNLVAWTTTPWTIPSNFALAVNKNFKYSLVKFNNEYFVVCQDRLQYTFDVKEDDIGDAGKTVHVIETFGGDKLEGLGYEPIYDYFVDESVEKDFKVYLLNDVTNDEGTGVLHIAPAFGEVDNKFGREVGLSMHADIDEDGKMTVGEWKGVYLRDASGSVAEDMARKGRLLRSEKYVHRLPYYRGDNPLIYMAQDSYFIDVQKIKTRMLEVNQDINWIPGHYKEGRFANTVETSPDWAVSRSRYWATVMPIWEAEDGEQLVVGSIAEMMEYTDQLEARDVDGQTVYYMDDKKFHLHRDFCDKVVLTKEGKEYHRVPEVLDCWFDSGSVPFAEYGFPFKNEAEFKQSYPADFIVEYAGQVRAWFNVLVRLSVINFDTAPFKNVICHGVMSGNDGRKMSKSYGNYTDPEDVLKNSGGEALRLYAMGSPLMAGGDMAWSDEELHEYIKIVLIPLWNTYRYFGLYATQHGWSPESTQFTSENPLDIWLQHYVNHVSNSYSDALESYDIPGSVRLIQPAIDTLSTWWIRRSRDRMATGDQDAMQTLYAALVHLTKTFAPQMPFLTEEIYQNLVVGAGLKDAKESVHLEFFPERFEVDQELLNSMDKVRSAASLGLSVREEKQVKLRQPLSSAYVNVENEDLQKILGEELNVKNVKYVASESDLPKDVEVKSENTQFVALDLTMTPELVEEGLYNELVRQLTVLRKESGLQVGDKVHVRYCTDESVLLGLLEKFEAELSEAVQIGGMEKVSELDVKDTKVNTYLMKFELKKI